MIIMGKSHSTSISYKEAAIEKDEISSILYVINNFPHKMQQKIFWKIKCPIQILNYYTNAGLKSFIKLLNPDTKIEFMKFCYFSRNINLESAKFLS